jgi:hypothetical protein
MRAPAADSRIGFEKVKALFGWQQTFRMKDNFAT